MGRSEVKEVVRGCVCGKLSSVFLDLDHVKPIHDHHGLDEIAPQVAVSGVRCQSTFTPSTGNSGSLPAVIHVRLYTHVESTQVFDTSLCVLNPHRLLIHAQCFVAL